MQKQTSPDGAGLISIDAFTRGIGDNSNHTTYYNLGKYKRIPPFADQLYKHARVWHVNVGEDSIDRTYAEYETYGKWKIAVMALPWGEDPGGYYWPIYDKTVDILSRGKHSEIVIQLAQELIACGAKQVYGRVNGEIVHWQNNYKEAA